MIFMTQAFIPGIPSHLTKASNKSGVGKMTKKHRFDQEIAIYRQL